MAKSSFNWPTSQSILSPWKARTTMTWTWSRGGATQGKFRRLRRPWPSHLEICPARQRTPSELNARPFILLFRDARHPDNRRPTSSASPASSRPSSREGVLGTRDRRRQPGATLEGVSLGRAPELQPLLARGELGKDPR